MSYIYKLKRSSKVRIRIYPKIAGVRPMLFAEVENIDIVRDGNKWSIEFDHVDHINKDRKVDAHSHFTSESAMAYTILAEHL